MLLIGLKRGSAILESELHAIRGEFTAKSSSRGHYEYKTVTAFCSIRAHGKRLAFYILGEMITRAIAGDITNPENKSPCASGPTVSLLDVTVRDIGDHLQ
jgi:hypothetical protein